MKGEIIIGVVSALIILGVAFFIFSEQQYIFTNFAVYNDSSEASVPSNENLNENIAATEENAIQAINDSEDIILEMERHNLSTTYMNDLLTEARKIFKKADYAGVLDYAEQIKERREKAFEIYDILTVVQMSLEKYEKMRIDMKEPENLFQKAKTAFYEDRYTEAEDLLQQTRSSIDSVVSEASLLGNLRKNALNFVQRNWYYLLGTLLVLAAVIFFSHKKLKLIRLKKKINRMKAEKTVLNELMKKAQMERFKENKISQLTYNIRIKEYRRKSAEIGEELPVFEKRLEKTSKKNLKGISNKNKEKKKR